MTTLVNACIYLVGLIFDLYLIILLLRLLLQKLSANYYNPISQLIIKLTDLFVQPLRRVFPGYRGFDFAIIFLLLVVALVEAFLLLWLRTRLLPHVSGVLVLAITNLCAKTLNLYFYAIMIRIFMSWIPSLQHNPVTDIVFILTEPLLGRARRIIPPLAGFDISAIPVLIVLQLISILMIGPLTNLGMRLALF